MIRLAILVEGQTEEEFVKSVLADHLRPIGVEPIPILLGGDVNAARLTKHMADSYWSFDFVTSLVDFYGFNGKGNRTVEELEEHLNERIQTRVGDHWDQRRVVPYVQKYEFEGLLFSDVNAFRATTYASEGSITQLSKVRSRFPTPEDINDDPNTAPSKRIANAIPSYRKYLNGPLVARELGLDVIREECPRFREWVGRLESLGEVAEKG